MSAFGFETLDRGSVYRTLRQLEKDGLVVSGWDTSKDGPARRLYSLTDSGRAYLEACAASLRGYQVMLNQFFTLYPWSAGAEDEPLDAAAPHATPANGNGNGAAKAAKATKGPAAASRTAKGGRS